MKEGLESFSAQYNLAQSVFDRSEYLLDILVASDSSNIQYSYNSTIKITPAGTLLMSLFSYLPY